MSQPVRRAAMEIILAEERAAGWTTQVLGVAGLEKQHGCDILSAPPDSGEPHPVEVKGWGEPFLTVRGHFSYHQDLRASQMRAAQRDPNFRIEMVANLTVYLAGNGPYERLTLTGAEILERAIPRLYDVPLTGKERDIRSQDAPPRPAPGNTPTPSSAVPRA